MRTTGVRIRGIPPWTANPWVGESPPMPDNAALLRQALLGILMLFTLIALAVAAADALPAA